MEEKKVTYTEDIEQGVIRKSGLIPRSAAPAVINQNFKMFGIKPDSIINFISNEPPFGYNPTLQIPQSSALRRLIVIRHVPALVCTECGNIWYTGTVAAELEKLVDEFASMIGSEVSVINFDKLVA